MKFDHFPLSLKDFYVIGVISNNTRYRSRHELFHRWEDYMNASGVNYVVVETAYGERPHYVTDSTNPKHIQLRTSHELWHKENMINVAMSKLPSNWKYVAWVDCDVQFARLDWAKETVHQLQHFKFVQMFQQAHDMDHEYNIIQSYDGFAYSYLMGKKYCGSKIYGTYWHPGFAWAARREAIEEVGGLIDTAIVGAADHHMALALIGDAEKSLHPEVHANYKKAVYRWESLAEKYIRRSVGYVPGTILHHWHGRKVDRKYWQRWDVLTKNHFDPEIDLKRDSQGLFQLTGENIGLRDDLMKYARARNEDQLP